MEETEIFPQIVNVTDLRYRWGEVTSKLEKSELPVLIIEHSTPKAVLFPFVKFREILVQETKPLTTIDPLVKWREKYGKQFIGWDATATIRKLRDSR